LYCFVIDNNNPIVVCFYRPNIIQGHWPVLILISFGTTVYSMPAGQSENRQCINLVNTDFFQNNTTNNNHHYWTHCGLWPYYQNTRFGNALNNDDSRSASRQADTSQYHWVNVLLLCSWTQYFSTLGCLRIPQSAGYHVVVQRLFAYHITC
jgi:hypothetical protein